MIDLFVFSLSGSVLEGCTFLRIYTFLPCCPYWHIVAQSSLLWLFLFCSVSCNLLLHISKFTDVSLSPFLLKESSWWFFYFIFSKKQLSVLLIFAVVFFISFPFISAMIFMISFLVLTFFEGVLPFLIALGVRPGCLFDVFIEVVLYSVKSPLRTAFSAAHRFWVVVFHLSFVSWHFFISFLISSVLSRLFTRILFSLRIFVFFFFYSFFPPCNWYLNFFFLQFFFPPL